MTWEKGSAKRRTSKLTGALTTERKEVESTQGLEKKGDIRKTTLTWEKQELYSTARILP